MGMVKQFLMDYCEAIHPDDVEAQDKLFESICSGETVVSMDQMQAAIKGRAKPMKAVIVKADRTVRIAELNGWDDIKLAIGGDPFLQALPVGLDFTQYVDEDGIARGLPRNEVATNITKAMLKKLGRLMLPGDYIKGTAVYIGIKDSDDPEEGAVETDLPEKVIYDFFGPYLLCKRRACQADYAVCVHSQTGDVYCVKCARKINEGNPEVPNLVRIPQLSRPGGV